MQIVTKVPQQQAFIDLPTAVRHDVISFKFSFTHNIQFLSLNYYHSFVHSQQLQNSCQPSIIFTHKCDQQIIFLILR